MLHNRWVKVSSCSEIMRTGQCRKKRKIKRSCVCTHTNPTNFCICWICSGIGYPKVSDRAEIHPVMCISVRSHLHSPLSSYLLMSLLLACMLCTAFLLVAMFSSLLFSLFINTLISFTWTEELSETASLPTRGRGKVCVHSTLPKPHSLCMLLYSATS